MRFIVTNKDVITQELNQWGETVHQQYCFLGDAVIGKKQLIEFIRKETEGRIMSKYYQQTLDEVLKEITLVKLNKRDFKKLFKFVKFIEPKKRNI